MNKIDEAFQVLKQLSPDEQDRAADLMLAFAAQQSNLSLSEEQLADLEQRLSEENPKMLSMDEVREHFRALRK